MRTCWSRRAFHPRWIVDHEGCQHATLVCRYLSSANADVTDSEQDRTRPVEERIQRWEDRRADLSPRRSQATEEDYGHPYEHKNGQTGYHPAGDQLSGVAPLHGA